MNTACPLCGTRDGHIGELIRGSIPKASRLAVLRVTVDYACAGSDYSAHDDWRIRYCPLCRRKLVE